MKGEKIKWCLCLLFDASSVTVNFTHIFPQFLWDMGTFSKVGPRDHLELHLSPFQNPQSYSLNWYLGRCLCEDGNKDPTGNSSFTGGEQKFVQICVTIRTIENIKKTTIKKKKKQNINTPSYPPEKRNILSGKQAVRQCISVIVFKYLTAIIFVWSRYSSCSVW